MFLIHRKIQETRKVYKISKKIIKPNPPFIRMHSILTPTPTNRATIIALRIDQLTSVAATLFVEDTPLSLVIVKMGWDADHPPPRVGFS